MHFKWHPAIFAYTIWEIYRNKSTALADKSAGYFSRDKRTVILSQELIIDGVPELQAFIDEVLPSPEEEVRFQQELLEIVVDTTEYIHE